MTRKLAERLKDAIDLLSQYQDGLDSCLQQLKEEAIDDNSALESSDSLTYSLLSEANISLIDTKLKVMRAHGLLTGELNYEEEYERYQKEEEEEFSKYKANMKGPRPVVYPEDLSLPTRKLIMDLAKIELEELDVIKKSLPKGVDQMDVALFNRNMILNKKGFMLREALLNSDLSMLYIELQDPVEHMKTMAAVLLFLYTHDKLRSYVMDRNVDESLYYAGANMYRHAVIMQKIFAELDNEDQ